MERTLFSTSFQNRENTDISQYAQPVTESEHHPFLLKLVE